MSIEHPAAHFKLEASIADGLKIARSDFIDAYNRVDASIRQRLASQKIKPHSMLGQNIDALQKLAAYPQYSKADKARVDGALDTFSSMQSIRCDIVHGTMAHLMIDGHEYAFFTNVQNQPCVGSKGLLLALDQLRALTQTLKALEEKLS